jgi:uncharacterized membrane-anchored protein
VVGLAIVLAASSFLVFKKERTLRSGARVFLALGTRDPRSLMQGDYMTLRYQIDWPSDLENWPSDGRLVLKLDDRGVGTLVRWHKDEPLAPGELLLRYRKRRSGLRLGAESFFFQEGTGAQYEAARFGELRVDSAGDSVLVGLRDERLVALGPDKP